LRNTHENRKSPKRRPEDGFRFAPPGRWVSDRSGKIRAFRDRDLLIPSLRLNRIILSSITKASIFHKILMKITICILLFASASLHAEAKVLTMAPMSDGLPLGYYLEYAADPGAISVTELREYEKQKKLIWVENKNSVPNLGYQSKAYWFRLTVDYSIFYEELPEHFIMEIAYPPLDNIYVFQPDHKNPATYNVSNSGDMLPVSSRLYFHRNFTFLISKPADKTLKQTYYIKINTESSVQLPITIWAQQKFIDEMNLSGHIYGIFYGIMIVMILYNLFLFFSIRDRSYLYYVIYICMYVLFQFTLNGYSILYLWPGSNQWNNMSLPVLVSGSVLAASVFSRKFLGLREHSRKLYFMVNSYIILVAAIILAEFFLPYSLAIRMAIISAMPAVVLMITAGFVSWRFGYSPAKYFLLAWLGFLAGTLLMSLKSLGLIPATMITTYAQQIGSGLEVLLLSLGLGDRINEFKKERERLQAEMIDSINRTNQAYSRFVPVEFLKLLEKQSIRDVMLGDQIEKDFTVMFIDIRSFAALSETMSPKENFNFLNSYLKRISPIITQNGGFIDKYIGDAVMALFPERPEDALLAAIQIRNELIAYNEHRAKNGYAKIEIGIGIHYGHLILGTIGSNERMEGTVISDAVNVSSRLESLTKKIKSHIIFSKSVLNKMDAAFAERFAYRYLGKVKVKGKIEGIPIYELFSGETDEQVELKRRTKQLFESATSRFSDAHAADVADKLAELLAINSRDDVARVYFDRAQKIVNDRKSIF